jgi:5-methylcytosine-specific restriction endonuclease McrA
MGKIRVTNEQIFCKDTHPGNLLIRARILDGELLEYTCAMCDIDTWQGKKINLELDHINGDRSDNRLKNLRFMCPNCHSQTDTFRGRGMNTGIKKVADSDLLSALRKYPNIRQALISVNLTPKGGNYDRAYKILAKNL